jgi:hypothetical protein
MKRVYEKKLSLFTIGSQFLPEFLLLDEEIVEEEGEFV